MTIDQVALQLYTLRDHLQTPGDVQRTLQRVAAIGYRAVQVSGLGPIGDDEVRRILEGEGLTLCATHEPPETILRRPQEVVEKLTRLGCRRTAYPFPAGVDLSREDEVRRLAADLDAAGEVLRAAGQTLSYHNHALEFVRVGSTGATALELIFANTDPRRLLAELDTYWVQFGGGDPAAWCRRLRGRLSTLHLKDYRFTPGNHPEFAEIGQGNLDFAAIIQAAAASGCGWFIVEQDHCAGDPFDSVRMSFDHIVRNLCEPATR